MSFFFIFDVMITFEQGKLDTFWNSRVYCFGLLRWEGSCHSCCDYLGFSFLDILCSHRLFLGIEKAIITIAGEEIKRRTLVTRSSIGLSTVVST